MKPLVKLLLICYIKLRWAVLHVHPHYMKFSMSTDSNECHFQNIKTGSIHSQLVLQNDA